MITAMLALAACRFTDDPSGTSFACDALCPVGFQCVSGRCLPDGARPDAATVIDASPPADGADAAAVADSGPADAMVDYCEAAMSSPNADLCNSGTPDITQAARAPGGTTVYANTTSYQNDLGTPATSCVGEATAASDAFYKVEAAAGENIYAHVDAQWNTILYLTSGCTTGVTCYAGENNVVSGEEVTHTMAQAGTVYIVVDADTYANFGCFALEVRLTGP